ncbi:MAG TPA: putative inorganic carbon transporter subunit DabA, partial [Balneolales bacterium]|nr:putative inorganic carbon transporter subunit DabA [Balneolales bacterium]
RLLADICNDPEVRKLLAEQYGIYIPEETWFLGAEHNTTTNHIHLFDQNVPDRFQQQIKKLRSNLEAAQYIANREQFNITLENKKKAIHEAQRRASDWAETRPEWGLAGNASFIIGRRELTSNLNLGARSFLHSYDWKKDSDGEKLEAILQGPMVVTQWINNHYYFASVDNECFGGGTKVTLNVTGKFGAVQGNGGDLKLGLPRESLQEDDHVLQHLPLRLTVLIQAPRSRVESIISKHENTLYNLVKNEWIYLAVLDPEMENEVTFIGDKVEKLEESLIEKT